MPGRTRRIQQLVLLVLHRNGNVMPLSRLDRLAHLHTVQHFAANGLPMTRRRGGVPKPTPLPLERAWSRGVGFPARGRAVSGGAVTSFAGLVAGCPFRRSPGRWRGCPGGSRSGPAGRTARRLGLEVVLAGGRRGLAPGELPVGQVVLAGAQDVPDPTERVAAPAARSTPLGGPCTPAPTCSPKAVPAADGSVRH